MVAAVDGIRRWIMPEGGFRVLVARSTAFVTEAARVAGTSPAVTARYGELLTGAALLQLAQAPIDRMQFTVVHGGTAGKLLADVWPGPTVRGRVEHPRPESEPVLGAGGVIQVTRQPIRGGAPYESVVPLPGGSIADALQRYVLESEQVLTFFALATVVDEESGHVRVAGGMIVQALPGMTREELEAMTAALEKARWDDLVRAGDDPFDATHALMSRLSLHHLGDDPIVYRCRCSREAALRAVSTLGEEGVAAIAGGGTETVTCEFCGTVYVIGPEDLT